MSEQIIFSSFQRVEVCSCCGWFKNPPLSSSWGEAIAYGLAQLDGVCPRCGEVTVKKVGRYEVRKRTMGLIFKRTDYKILSFQEKKP